MSSLSEANMKFALNLFRQFQKSEDNIFYSPFSIMSALAMLLFGTRGNTEHELEQVLQVDGGETEKTKKETAKTVKTEKAAACHDEKSENVLHQFHKLITQLNKSTDAYDLKTANSIYGDKKFKILQEYLEDVKKLYSANVESLDFLNAADESRKKINSWVESQTNGKIQDLFPNGTLDSSTVLVLVNAVYFKGQWDEKFDKNDTIEEKFWLSKEKSKPVQMMRQMKEFRFALLQDAQAKILEIPYKGKDLSMILLLPNDLDGLKKLEDNLTAEKLAEWTSPQSMHPTEVELSLPRFKVEESYDLEDTLQHMGMVDAFSAGKADLSGISGDQSLVVSKVKHKSFVEVNEEGTEAAAATGVSVSEMSMPITQDFNCNHPFLFYIKHNKTQTILFLGRLLNP